MRIDRRNLMLGALAGGTALAMPAIGKAKDLRSVKVGIGFAAMSPGVINLFVAEPLGFAAENGIKIEGAALGTANNAMIAIDNGSIDIGVVSSSFFMPLRAKGQMSSIQLFYEYTYPYKWDIAVRPDSPIKTYAELRGKKIGVSNLGVSDYPVTRTVLNDIGIDPNKDVSWLAVGEGSTAGVALTRGDIDALGYFDSGFGTIENAGIKLRYLPRPSKVPMIGGLFLGYRKDFLAANKDLCIAYAKSVAQASEFLIANPQAGSSAFLKMFPATAPRNVTPEQAVEKTVVSIRKRIDLYAAPYPNAKMGQIFESEFETEAKMLDIKDLDYKSFYSNELIDRINDFDRAKLIAAAKAAKI